MNKKATKSISSMDAAVVKAVEELRAYAKSHPEAGTAKSVLDAILDRLVQEILEIETAESEEKLPILLLEELAALFPDSATPLLYLSKICLDKGDPNEALEYAETGLRVEPDHPDLDFNRALVLLETGKQNAGIDGFRRYIELNPDNPWAYNNIGDAYRKLGNYDEAEKYFKLAIERDNRFFPAIYNLVMLYTDQKDWTCCVHHGQIAERLDPSNKEVQLALGDAYMGLSDPRSALQHLVKATLIDKDFAEAYETTSCAYADLGMHELAAAAAQEALRVNPNSWMALANIGYTESMRGKYVEAIKHQHEALRCHPDQEGTYKICWGLGWNYLQTDQYSKALKFTDQAISLKEAHDIILSFNKGLILLAQGKSAESYEVYRRAMARACSSDNYRAIIEGIGDLRDFVTKRGIQIEQESPFLELLGREFDLMRLLASSKNWGQDIKPELFETICMQGQRLSEKDLREIRSTLKKKTRKARLH